MYLTMLDALKNMPDDPDDLKGLVSMMGDEIKSQAYQIEKLKAELAGHRKARFGSKSEGLDQLIFDLTEDKEIEAAAEEQKSEQVADVDTKSKRQHSRKPLPGHLERCEEVLSPGETCDCGGTLRQIGEDVTEEQEYIPGRFVVNKVIRPRMTCKDCEGFAQAQLPSRPIEGGRPGKRSSHLPVHGL